MKKQGSGPITVVSPISKLLPKAKEACLVMLYGPELGKRYSLHEDLVIIGRGEESDIYLERESVSRSHAQVFQGADGYTVQDLESTNGTFLNNVQVFETAALCDGDQLKTGDVIFKFLSEHNLENIYHEEIYRLATTDELTHAHNKRFFLDCLDREFCRVKRHNREMSLIILDLDYFKKINDSYGHPFGDFILQKTAYLLQNHIRREDIFARYGGEEFTLLLPESGHDEALQIAEKLRSLTENQRSYHEGKEVLVTLSLGVASVSPSVLSSVELLELADKNLYQAKRNGRNQVYG